VPTTTTGVLINGVPTTGVLINGVPTTGMLMDAIQGAGLQEAEVTFVGFERWVDVELQGVVKTDGLILGGDLECFVLVHLELIGLVIVHPRWQFVIVSVVAVETVIVRLLTNNDVGVGQYVVKAVTTVVVYDGLVDVEFEQGFELFDDSMLCTIGVVDVVFDVVDVEQGFALVAFA